MNNDPEKTAEQMAGFQKIWLDSFAKMAQAAFTFTPDSAPPEVLRQIRSGIFQALAQSWDEFLRSPQFLEGTKQWMDNAIAFRQMSNEFLAKARHDLQAPGREDIDGVLPAIRHTETRVLDRIEELAAQIQKIEQRLDRSGPKQPTRKAPVKKSRAKRSRQSEKKQPRRKR